MNDLPLNEQNILNEFNNLRNWGLHIPESLFIKKREMFNMNSNFIESNQNIISIPSYDYFEIRFLKVLKREIQEILESSSTILKRIKDDYEALIAEKVKIKSENN